MQEDLGLIFGQGTRYHTAQLKILHATTKTQHSQINELIKKKKTCMRLTADQGGSATVELLI